jgi:hypothetical protein
VPVADPKRSTRWSQGARALVAGLITFGLLVLAGWGIATAKSALFEEDDLLPQRLDAGAAPARPELERARTLPHLGRGPKPPHRPGAGGSPPANDGPSGEPNPSPRPDPSPTGQGGGQPAPAPAPDPGLRDGDKTGR